jgi:hypothetical protein
VTGAGAKALLKVKPGTDISFGAVRRGPRGEQTAVEASPYTSSGPSAGGLAKPDMAAPGSALTVTLGGGAAVAGGTAVAAARVAAAAADLARAHPELTPAQLRAELMASADPADLPPARTGAGALRVPPEVASGGAAFAIELGSVTADPPSPASGLLDPVTFRLTATASAALRLTSTAQVTPARLTVRPGQPATVTVRPPGPGAGRVVARNSTGQTVASIPFLVRPQNAAGVPLGPLRVSGSATRRRVVFALGAFTRGDPLAGGTDIRFADRLVLDLVDAAGKPVKTLTLPGGARELMPADYAYTVPKPALQALPPGRYRFRARAWAPGHAVPTQELSAPFAE